MRTRCVLLVSSLRQNVDLRGDTRPQTVYLCLSPHWPETSPAWSVIPDKGLWDQETDTERDRHMDT